MPRFLILLFGIFCAVSQTWAQIPDSLLTNPVHGLKTSEGTLRVYPISSRMNYIYLRPPNSRYLTFPLKNYDRYFRTTFRGDNIPYIGAMIIGTGFLVDIDQEITKQTMKLGDRWGIKHTHTQKPVVKWSFKLGDKTIRTPLNLPHDAETAMYFLGDGILHGTIAASFWSYGQLAGDERAIQTGTQCVEAILCTGIAIQVLKHSFGRETAAVATHPGGRWRFFPDPVKYGDNVPYYDAMPSGHVATLMATVTVISENYPEQKWIRPTGYSLLGALMFAMINNGVHWASDYPLGISIGYTFAKIVSSRGKTVIEKPLEGHAARLQSLWQHTQALPYVRNGGGGFQLVYRL
ncbi:MAG: phosphatase PAP2 family protein [Calditrichota bacterium]